MHEHKKGFQAELSQVVSYVQFIEHVIHTRALISYDLQPQPHNVLQKAAKILNLGKSRRLNSRFYAVQCNQNAGRLLNRLCCNQRSRGCQKGLKRVRRQLMAYSVRRLATVWAVLGLNPVGE